MVSVYVTTKEKGSGNTSICAGIGKLVLNAGKKPGYLKPLLSAGNDGDAAFVKDALSLDEPVDVLEPVISGTNFAAGIKKVVAGISQGKDVVIIDGLPEHYQSSSDIAKDLNAKILIVDLYTEDISQAIELSIKIAGKDDLICITGSLHTVGEAKEYFQKTGKKF